MLNNLNQLIENEIRKEVKGVVIWSNDLKINSFATSLNKNYATIVNRRTVRLIDYEIFVNEKKIKIISLKEFPISLTEEKAITKAEKIKERIEEHDELISLRENYEKLTISKEKVDEEIEELKKQLQKFNFTKEENNQLRERVERLENQIIHLQSKLSNQRNILLIGHTGKGKSTLANVLTSTNKFKESEFAVSETKNIQTGQFKHNGIKYQIIDTVGIGDTKLSEQEVLHKIAEAVHAVRYGLSQVLFVTSGRFTQEERVIYEELLKKAIFDQNIANYTTIVRTNFPNFSNESKCQADITKMKANNQELAEVITTCRKFIHVNNPPIDVDDEEELKIYKKAREKSRIILLEHLTENCQDIYKPKNLEELSTRISKHIKEKEILEQQIISLQTKGNLNKEEVKKLNKLQEEKKKQDEFISQETLQHLQDKGISWEKAAKYGLQGAGVITGVAGVIVTALCRVM